MRQGWHVDEADRTYGGYPSSSLSVEVPQVWRWGGQYRASLLEGETPLPEMLRLGEWLATHVPLGDNDPATTRISHGDFRSVTASGVQPGCCCHENPEIASWRTFATATRKQL